MQSAGSPLTPFQGDALERFASLPVALDAFFADLTLTASKATHATYRSLLRDLDGVEALTPPVCRQLVTDRFRRCKPGTARTFRAALAAFCVWGMDHHYFLENPILEVPKPKMHATQRKVPTKRQLRAMWDAALDDRDRLILLLLGQGLRRAEACSLRFSDIRPDGTAQIVGKGGKVRRIALPEAAILLISSTRMLASRKQAAEARSGPRSQKLSTVLEMAPATLYDRIKQMGERAGIPWISPHGFRHAWATFWMIETQDMQSVRQLGGWSDNSTMPLHYARLALEESAVIKARKVNLDLYGE